MEVTEPSIGGYVDIVTSKISTFAIMTWLTVTEYLCHK